MALPEVAEYVVERCAPLRARADLDIEERAHDLSLPVVADAAIAAVLVRAVELDPSVEGSLLERLDEAPGNLVDRGDLVGEVILVLVDRAQPGDGQGAPAVIARRSLEPPEKASVILFLIAIRKEPRRADPLDVPDVEELVRDEREKV